MVHDAGACVTLAALRGAWDEAGGSALTLKDLEARLAVALETASKEDCGNRRAGFNFFGGWRLVLPA